jgi:hypothetical protein
VRTSDVDVTCARCPDCGKKAPIRMPTSRGGRGGTGGRGKRGGRSREREALVQRSRSSGPGVCVTCGARGEGVGSGERGGHRARPQEEVKRQSGRANGAGREAGAPGVGDQGGEEGRGSLPVHGVNGQGATELVHGNETIPIA